MVSGMRVIGVMSGSSLDGIDLALCVFSDNEGRWTFDVEAAHTVAYLPELRERLLHATQASALELARLDRDVGQAIGKACHALLQEHGADAIASHGHTIFHQPAERLTTQVGNGPLIAAITGATVVCDFRSLDVARGGQGAPLVPFGELFLFPEHKAFVNLGGIANLSVHGPEETIGYDIGPCNQALDLLATEAGKPYDAEGAIARSGRVDPILFTKLNALSFYAQHPPRSLGREWFEEQMRPLLQTGAPLPDRMATVVEHTAHMIAAELGRWKVDRALFTGGGAHNDLLMERIAALGTVIPELPTKELIDFKEAIIFAFLGLKRLRNEPNILASVTGASQDSIGGAVHRPN